MKLPNGERAFIDERKLRDYSLDPQHPRGRHKARVFLAALGFTQAHVPILMESLRDATRSAEASPGEADAYGEIYVIDFPMTGEAGTATVRSVWMIRAKEDFPRLVSCYIVAT